jgi:serine/threonine protein phosphatase PrpC
MPKTKELKTYNHFGATHTGNVREINEDAFAFFESINGCFFVLCDGMGGVKGGKKAAEITIAEIEKTINASWEKDIPKLLTSVFENANTAVYKNFAARKFKPGTTLVVVLIRNNKVWYAHAGDSRVYYQPGRKLFQITKDHSYVEELIDQKEITREEALDHPRRNEITKAIGIHPYIQPDICKEPLNPNDDDYILLCSDGLTNELSDKEILSILKNNKTEKAKTEQLIDLTLKKGAHDNVTVQLIRFYNTGNAGKEPVIPKPPRTRKKKRIRISGISLLLIITALFFWFYREPIFKTSENIENTENRYSSIFIDKLPEKPVMLQKTIYSKAQLEEWLSLFGLNDSDVHITDSLFGKNERKNIAFPVKNIYFHRPGKELFSYPGINNNNIIDILKVNKKSELFFKPGEIIVVPADN